MTRRLINDGWLFQRRDVGPEGFDEPAAERVDLPHTWNGLDGQDGGNDYHRGRCWYRKILEINLEPGNRIWLEFRGANSVAEVWVNRHWVGEHVGGYSAFRFDITDALTDGDTPGNRPEAEILVGVDNSEHPDIYPIIADYTFMGGIYRDVYLLTAGPIRFDLDDDGSDGLYVTAVNTSPERAILQVRPMIVCPEELVGNAVWSCTLRDHRGREVAAGKKQLTGDRHSQSATLTLENPRLWRGLADPSLYTVEAEIHAGGRTVDSRSIPFGIRDVAIDPADGFRLNGERLRLNGVCRHQDRRDIGWALSTEHHDEDMRILLEVGANAVRLAHYQHDGYFFDLCDRRGIVAWAEIPFITAISETDKTGSNAKNQLIELIKQNYHRPSIAFWGVQNEITIGGPDKATEEIVRMLHETARSLDPTRITVQAQVGHHPKDDAMNRATDALGYNKYYGWYYDECEDFDPWLGNFADTQPDIPLGISEYGCEAILRWHSEQPRKGDYSEQYQALYHEKVLHIFRRHPRLWGTFVWNLFDFASDFRDEGGVKGMNHKGLVTHDRRVKKDAFYWYKANWSDEPVLHIASRRFVHRYADAVDVKVYSHPTEPELAVNGQSVGPPEDLFGNENPGRAWLFRNVPLAEGENVLRARAGEQNDEVRWIGVAEPDPGYIAPESDGAMDSAANWFDEAPGDKTLSMEYPEGRFSIKDRISKILKNPEGEAALRRIVPQMFDHPMFGMIKTLSFERIAGMKPDLVPDGFLEMLNRELNGIKKGRR